MLQLIFLWIVRILSFCWNQSQLAGIKGIFVSASNQVKWLEGQIIVGIRGEVGWAQAKAWALLVDADPRRI